LNRHPTILTGTIQWYCAGHVQAALKKDTLSIISKGKIALG